MDFFKKRPANHYWPRLVVSHSTCAPLSSSPHAHSFVLGTAVINNNMNNVMKKWSISSRPSWSRCRAGCIESRGTHTQRSLVRDGQTCPHRPRLVVSRSTCPPHSTIQLPQREHLCDRSCSNKQATRKTPGVTVYVNQTKPRGFSNKLSFQSQCAQTHPPPVPAS